MSFGACWQSWPEFRASTVTLAVVAGCLFAAATSRSFGQYARAKNAYVLAYFLRLGALAASLTGLIGALAITGWFLHIRPRSDDVPCAQAGFVWKTATAIAAGLLVTQYLLLRRITKELTPA